MYVYSQLCMYRHMSYAYMWDINLYIYYKLNTTRKIKIQGRNQTQKDPKPKLGSTGLWLTSWGMFQAM